MITLTEHLYQVVSRIAGNGAYVPVGPSRELDTHELGEVMDYLEANRARLRFERVDERHLRIELVSPAGVPTYRMDLHGEPDELQQIPHTNPPLTPQGR